MIEVEELTKRYGAHTAVDQVSFTVEPGSVTGFLGPNGAGKSTTMRMLVGLTPPTSGHSTVLGMDYRGIPNPGRSVGVLLDASAQHAGRSGREILTVGAMLMDLPRTRVDEMLELVGLTGVEAKRRVRNYSLGMRQRLGIGHALLGDPHVLILDEPANGLDPAGIRWMRGLLRDFAEKGGTVLLSSHLLSEIEIIADELVVIGRGAIVAEGSKAQMVAQAGARVRALDPEQLAGALTGHGLSFARLPDNAFLVEATTEQVGRVAAGAAIVLIELSSGGVGLEDMFLELTSDDIREGASA